VGTFTLSLLISVTIWNTLMGIIWKASTPTNVIIKLVFIVLAFWCAIIVANQFLVHPVEINVLTKS